MGPDRRPRAWIPQWCYMARPRGRGPAEGAAGEAIVHTLAVYHPRNRARRQRPNARAREAGLEAPQPRVPTGGDPGFAPAVRRRDFGVYLLLTLPFPVQ